MKRRYTDEELEMIKDPLLTAPAIERITGRSADGVRRKRRKIGITPQWGRKFSDEELQFICAARQTMTVQQIADKLGTTYYSVDWQLRKLRREGKVGKRICWNSIY